MYIHEVNDSIDNHHTTYSIVYSYVPSFMGDSKMGGNIRNDTEIYVNDTILQEIYVMKESNYEWNP